MKQIVLQFISGADAHKEQTFDVSEDLSITIGREATNKIVVADTEIMVSRKHATIRFASTFDSTEENPQYELIIVDSSSNGTFVNGKKVNPDTYFYLMKYVDASYQVKEIKGFVTVIL